jgi:hypothetical protein
MHINEKFEFLRVGRLFHFLNKITQKVHVLEHSLKNILFSNELCKGTKCGAYYGKFEVSNHKIYISCQKIKILENFQQIVPKYESYCRINKKCTYLGEIRHSLRKKICASLFQKYGQNG